MGVGEGVGEDEGVGVGAGVGVGVGEGVGEGVVLPVGFVGEAELPPPPPPQETRTSEANRNAINNLFNLDKILHLQ